MISGVVTPQREAVITLEVQDRNGRRLPFEAVIDTGFTDYLTLPPSMIDLLGLPVKGATRITLGDDVAGFANVHMAEVVWGGKPRKVPVLALQGVPLIGMSMLAGHQLHIHVVDGGTVTIS